MKASLKLREEHQNPLFRAKLPITVLNLPFISALTAGDSSDLSFHVRTASVSGPSLKLSYHPNNPYNPFALSVKSGIGIWGSAENSPLVMTANFSLIGNLNPSFSLQIRPDFGDFAFRKTTFSNPNPNSNPMKENGELHHINGGDHTMWRDLTEFNSERGFLSGVAVTAKTVLPVGKRAAMKFRWGVNFPAEFGRKKLPFLTVDKLKIERVEEVKQQRNESVSLPSKLAESVADTEVLKGMCIWMGREMEILQKENKSMKESIDELKTRIPCRNGREMEASSKKTPEIGKSNGFEKGGKKNNGGIGNGRKETKPSGFSSAPAAVDVGEELKRAIKAASS